MEVNKLIKSLLGYLKRLYPVVTIVFIFFVVLILFSYFGNSRDIYLLSVESGSMEPAIRTGSLIVVSPAEYYQKQDVISYRSTLEGSPIVTHRIVDTPLTMDGVMVYKTQGDANNAEDANPIYQEDIVGKVRFAFPLLGYLINFLKTPEGFVVLILIPSIIIIVKELNIVKEELSRLLKKRRKQEFGELNQNLQSKMPALILVVLIASIFIVKATYSVFFTSREIDSNSVSTGWWVNSIAPVINTVNIPSEKQDRVIEEIEAPLSYPEVE